jgi:hypothetical protein
VFYPDDAPDPTDVYIGNDQFRVVDHVRSVTCVERSNLRP